MRCKASGADKLNAFLTTWLVRLYSEFDGDVLQAIVLGELAASGPCGVSTVHPNAFAIAQATGIPRETIRRKIAALEAKGWVRKNAEGTFGLTPAAHRHFGAWMLEVREAVLRLSEGLHAMRSL